MRLLKQPGGSVYVAEAPLWKPDCPTREGRDHLLIGVMPDVLKLHANVRAMSVHVGQLFGVIDPGLITAQHCFRGLKRGMMVGDDEDAAKKKLAVTWAAKRDAFLGGRPQSTKIEHREAPPNKVFVVYISPNEMLTGFPQIHGWAEHWTWVAADPAKAGAPIDYDTRYDECLWSAK